MAALSFLSFAALVAACSGHGSLVHPRPRNSIDYLASVNEQTCANITGDKCENGQASFWYSQGCFIGCPECDHASGRRQTDLCKLGKKSTVNDPKYRSVNRNATAGSPQDIYRHNVSQQRKWPGLIRCCRLPPVARRFFFFFFLREERDSHRRPSS